MGVSREDKEFLDLTKKLLAMEDCEQKDGEKEKMEEKWHELWLELDRIEFREYSDPEMAEVMSYLIKFTQRDPFDWYCGDDGELRNWWEQAFSYQWVNHVHNYFRLVPPYVRTGTRIPDSIAKLYHESRWCFVFGMNNACIAMVRALLEEIIEIEESIIQTLMKPDPKSGHRRYYFLHEKLEEFGRRRKIDSNLIEKIKKKIILKGNNILHKGEFASDSEAEDAIEYMKNFLEETYSRKPYKDN